jgi:ornithine carbamoyltransferase
MNMRRICILMQVLADDARAAAPAPPHLLSLDSVTPDGLEELLGLAAELKADPDARADALAGRTVLMHFTKPSTRTRISFEAAIARLGGTAVFAGADELQLGRGEPIRDTARVVSRYCAAIVIRTHAHADVAEFAWWSAVPVVNALTDAHHPCQALADLLTLQERFGMLAGLEVAYVGDANNVCNSLVQACALAGAHVRVAAPPAYRPAQDLLAGAVVQARKRGGSVDVLDDPAEAVAGAHAVYTDVHVSMGEEALRDAKLGALARYQVDETLMARARPEAVFMHCLPAHRGEEVTEDVLEGRQSVVFDQAENRLHTAAAALVALTR